MNAFGYRLEDMIGLRLSDLMQVDPELAGLTVAPEDLAGLDLDSHVFFGTLVSRVLARSAPKQVMPGLDMTIYEHAETEV